MLRSLLCGSTSSARLCCAPTTPKTTGPRWCYCCCCAAAAACSNSLHTIYPAALTCLPCTWLRFCISTAGVGGYDYFSLMGKASHKSS